MINKYDEILKNEQENEMCLFNKAIALYKKENYIEASKIFEILLNKNNDNIEVIMGLGICYFNLN